MTTYSTYCPEDDKLRLYCGRVPRDEYERLRSEGWTSTPKQNCDFVAVWTPIRYATALEYGAGIVEDEDQTPEDRAADRAERFAGYRDKRTAEAVGHADRFDGQPLAHGFQSAGRAERAASRHDRIADRATDAWSKAEYWQSRTAGVISHALYRSRPDVRMGRIKEIEAELRKCEKELSEYAKRFRAWKAIPTLEGAELQTGLALRLAGSHYGGNDYAHPRTGRKGSLWSLGEREGNADPLSGAEMAELWLAGRGEPATESQWTAHLKLRLAYENQMLEAQGGRAAFVEMQVGGWLGGHQIRKVNKSPATGRVVSVALKVPGDKWGRTKEGFHMGVFNIERLPTGAYRPPTQEDLAALATEKKNEKSSAPKKAPCPLINPTDEDAERLQSVLNERAKDAHCASHMRRYGRDYADDFKPSTVCRIPQAVYSANSKGSFARAEIRGLCADMQLEPAASNMYSSHEAEEKKKRGPKACEIRTTSSDGNDYGARRVIVLTDKPQKPLPAAVWAVWAKLEVAAV